MMSVTLNSCHVLRGLLRSVVCSRSVRLLAPRYTAPVSNESPARGNVTASSLLNDGRRSVSEPQHSSSVLSLSHLVSVLQQENALDICVVRVPEHLQYAEFLVLASGSSTRHLKAMTLCTVREYKFLKQDSDPHVRIEGLQAEDWMCVDFGPVVVHFMLPETREKYELEKLWTLRSYDEQLRNIPQETLPADFIFNSEPK